MNILGIIPSRYASTRLPGKPLLDIDGRSLLQRVFDQVKQCKALSHVMVATDDERIEKAASNFGATVVLTDPEHPSGTDRCFEALQKLGGSFEAVVNIQGDEPFIAPRQIEQVCDLLKNGAEIATLIKPFRKESDVADPNKVKVVFNDSLKARYFSRSVIPFDRNGSKPQRHQHVGIYGYRCDILERLVSLDPSDLELAESLEQLRWLENGFDISLGITELESMGVDTPEDLEKAREFARTFV